MKSRNIIPLTQSLKIPEKRTIEMSIKDIGLTFLPKILTLLVAVSMLGSCQTIENTPLSLDEAKKFTANFKGGLGTILINR